MYNRLKPFLRLIFVGIGKNRSSFLFMNTNLSFITQRTLAGTEQLLRFPWIFANGKHHKQYHRPLSSFGTTVPEMQGSKELRQATAKETARDIHVLSPQALRKMRWLNHIVSDILKFKRLAHALGIVGKIPLPEETECPLKSIDLEGFHETFALPMLASSFEQFSQTCGDYSTRAKATQLKAVFDTAIYQDNMSEAKLLEACEQIHGGSKIPLLLGAGWDWHSTQLIIHGDYFIYCNRGDDSKVEGWHLYAIGDKSKITPEWLRTITNRLAVSKDDYLSMQKIVEDLQATPIASHPMRCQKGGFCTYTGVKTAILALLTLLEIDENYPSQINENEVSLAAKRASSIYKSFSNLDKQLVLKDFLIDLKEQMQENPVDPSVEKMAQLVHTKLISHPSLGFKLGWDLWLEVVDQCEKLLDLPPLAWREAALKLAEIPPVNNVFPLQEVYDIGMEFATQENSKMPADIIINQLMKIDAFEQAISLMFKINNKFQKESVFKSILLELIIRKRFQEAFEMTERFSSGKGYQFLNDLCREMSFLNILISEDYRLINKGIMGIKRLSLALEFNTFITLKYPEQHREESLKRQFDIVDGLLEKSEFSKALKIASSMPDEGNKSLSFLRICRSMANNGLYAEATTLAESIPVRNKKNAAFGSISCALAKGGRIKEALVIARKLFGVPKDSAWSEICFALASRGDVNTALASLDEISDEESRFNGIERICGMFIEKKQFSEAKLFCDKIPTDNPQRLTLINKIKAIEDLQ